MFRFRRRPKADSAAPSVATQRDAPAPTIPEWQTKKWQYKVEAEARHRLKDGIGGISREH